MQEHAPVDHGLAARPVDLLEQLGHGLGQDDVAAEGGHLPAQRLPAGRSRVDGHHDLLRPHGAVLGADHAVLDPRHPRVLVEARLACHGPPQREHQASGMHRGAVAQEDALAEDRRGDAGRDLLARERHGLVGEAKLARRLDLVADRVILCRRRRDAQHPALAQPDVDALGLREGAHARDDRLARACDVERGRVAEALSHPRQVRPVAVAEAAVAAARPAAALVGLEDDDVERRLPLLQRERGPEARETAADDGDVRVRVTRERRRGLAAEAGGERLVDPPRRC